MAAMLKDYQQLRAEWGGFAGYDRFFDNLNNSKLASVAIYQELVPQFQRLLAEHGGDLATFYAEVKKLAALSKEERMQRLSGAQ